MQLYKHNTSCHGTHKQAGGRSVDAALFAEELTEIYSIRTPNAIVTPDFKDEMGCIILCAPIDQSHT